MTQEEVRIPMVSSVLTRILLPYSEMISSTLEIDVEANLRVKQP